MITALITLIIAAQLLLIGYWIKNKLKKQVADRGESYPPDGEDGEKEKKIQWIGDNIMYSGVVGFVAAIPQILFPETALLLFFGYLLIIIPATFIRVFLSFRNNRKNND